MSVSMKFIVVIPWRFYISLCQIALSAALGIFMLTNRIKMEICIPQTNRPSKPLGQLSMPLSKVWTNQNRGILSMMCDRQWSLQPQTSKQTSSCLASVCLRVSGTRAARICIGTNNYSIGLFRNIKGLLWALALLSWGSSAMVGRT